MPEHNLEALTRSNMILFLGNGIIAKIKIKIDLTSHKIFLPFKNIVFQGYIKKFKINFELHDTL